MASTDITLRFGADLSALQDGVGQAGDLLAGLDPVIAALAQPMQAFQASVTQAFGDTAPATAWSQSVQTASSQASAASLSAATVIGTAWNKTMNSLGGVYTSNINQLLKGTETFQTAFTNLGEQMLSRFLGWCLQMATQWAVKEITQTAASASGAAARTTTELASQTAGLAASATTAMADISNSAGRAAAGAYAATASTPIVGPILAPAAAATALAAVLEFGGQVFSAAGGWGQVPSDGSLTALHKDEMVLPASIAGPLRAMTSSWSAGSGPLAAPNPASASSAGPGGASGDVHHHWNIQAVDARSFSQLARANPDAITGAMSAAAQKLGLTQNSFTNRGFGR